MTAASDAEMLEAGAQYLALYERAMGAAEKASPADIKPRRTELEQAGGKIHVEEQEIPGMGSLSLFTDPEGRMNGLFKPMMQAKKTKKRKK